MKCAAVEGRAWSDGPHVAHISTYMCIDIDIGTRLVRRPLTCADLPDARQDGRIDRRRAQRRIVGTEAAA